MVNVLSLFASKPITAAAGLGIGLGLGLVGGFLVSVEEPEEKTQKDTKGEK